MVNFMLNFLVNASKREVMVKFIPCMVNTAKNN